MRASARLLLAAGAAATLLALTGCSGVAPLPHDETFHACLVAAGQDPEEMGDADSRAEAFTDPVAMACVLELDPDGQRDALAGVYDTDGLLTAIADWIAQSPEGPDPTARDAGDLLAAGGDLEDHDVTGGKADEYLAWQVYVHANGEPAAYDAWLADEAAQDSVPQADAFAGPSMFLDWLEEHGGDSEEYALAQEVRHLQDLVADGRDD